MSQSVNCAAAFKFRVTPTVELSPGVWGNAPVGTLTGIKLRLAATSTGTAIHADVNALPATEDSDEAGAFYVLVGPAELTAHILSLGVGRPFWAIWSKAGDFDMESTPFRVAAYTRVT